VPAGNAPVASLAPALAADDDHPFARLQRRLGERTAGTRAIIALPSIDLGSRYADRTDIASYEMRWLYWLFALRQPDVRVAVITSDQVADYEVEYYLSLIPDAPNPRERLALLALGDLDKRPLAAKMLDRPGAIAAIQAFAGSADMAWFAPFSVNDDMRRLALATGIPVLGIDPRFERYATKSGARELFERQMVAVPEGFRDIRSAVQVDAALAALGRTAVVKLDEGVTGDGNAILRPGEGASDLPSEILRRLHHGAVVEELLDISSSPSAQVRILPGGLPELIATHDQVLGGELGQTYTGCEFPAEPPVLAEAIAREAAKVGRRLAAEGAVGRFAVDFVVAAGRPYAVEINLREGGTSHPHGALELLTGGLYDAPDGVFATPLGIRSYVATDALVDPHLKGTDGRAVIAAVRGAGLEWDPSTHTGIVLFMLRAVAIEGRVAYVAVARDRSAAEEMASALRSALAALAPA
jgi:hypothetical protein